MNKLKKKINHYSIQYPTRVYVIVLIGICIICSLFTYNKIFPITGGFYSVAAKSMENGMLPYKDFQLLFPPVYIYIIRLLCEIFGYSFIVIRIFGIIVFCLEAILLFYIFKRLFNNVSAFAGSLIAVFMMQSGNAFTAYDYGRIHDIFIYIAILFLFAILSDDISYKKSLLLSLLSGICMGLTIATRQSSGILVAVTIGGLLCAKIIFLDHKSQGLLDFFAYCVGITLFLGGLILVLKSENMLSAFLNSTTTEALSAKGGILQALFGWIKPAVIRMWTSKYYIIIGCVWGIVCYKAQKTFPKDGNKKENNAWIVLSGVFILFMILSYSSLSLALYAQKFYNDNIPYIIFLILFLSFVVLLGYFLYLKLIKNIVNYKLVLFLSLEAILIAISWGGAMSASLGFLTGYSTLGLFCALAVYFVSKAQRHILENINLLFVFAFCAIFFCNKIVAPYSWWGLNEGSTDKLIYTVDLPYMEGIRTSKQTKCMLEEISQIIKQNADDNDEIFAYPHMPIYYLLTDHQPFTYSYIQWFDVSSDKALKQDMKKIEQVQPKIIIMECLPDFVFDGHEKSFRAGEKSQQRIMQEQLLEFVTSNNYAKVKEINEQNDYVIQVYVKDYEEKDSLVTEDVAQNDYELSVTPEDAWYSVELEEDKAVVLDISREQLRKIYVDGKECSISEKNGYACLNLKKGTHTIEIIFQEWSRDLVYPLIFFITMGCCYLLIETYLALKKEGSHE